LTTTFLPWWGPGSRREWDGAEASPRTRSREAAGIPKAGKVNPSLRQDLPELVESRPRDGSVAREQRDRRTTNRLPAWTTIGEARLLWCRGSTWEKILSEAVFTDAKESMMASRPSNLAEGIRNRMDIAEVVTRGKKKT
jgi:hypothetical protein